jgi:hypothetical protein
VAVRHPPRTRFAKSGGLNIAYQVVGEGESDLVWVPGYISHLDWSWSNPELARLFERLSSALWKFRRPQKWQIELIEKVTWWSRKMRIAPPHRSAVSAPCQVPTIA